MRVQFVAAVIATLCIGFAQSADTGDKNMTALSFKMKDIDGKEVDLSKYQGKVVMFVNVASQCGFTPQYEALEALYKKDKDKGLVIIGVPANNFGKQEPGSDAEIKEFCSSKFHVTFPMMSKVSVLGDDMTPLYKYLTTHAPEKGDVKWNFEKFVVSKKGEVVARFRRQVKPDSKEITSAIDAELAK
jgi:glutathione peroxidase